MWKESAKQPFNGKLRAVNYSPVHDGAVHEYAVEIAAGELAGIRIDPGTAAGSYALESLEIRAAAESVFAWPAAKD